MEITYIEGNYLRSIEEMYFTRTSFSVRNCRGSMIGLNDSTIPSKGVKSVLWAYRDSQESEEETRLEKRVAPEGGLNAPQQLVDTNKNTTIDFIDRSL